MRREIFLKGWSGGGKLCAAFVSLNELLFFAEEKWRRTFRTEFREGKVGRWGSGREYLLVVRLPRFSKVYFHVFWRDFVGIVLQVGSC